MISMAASLGTETVAEGAEDKATFTKLVAMGCDMGQSSKPVPEDVLSERLHKRQENRNTTV